MKLAEMAKKLLVCTMIVPLIAGYIRTGAVPESETAGTGVSGKISSAEVPAWALKETKNYTFDFTETDSIYYQKHEELSVPTRTGLLLQNGHLECKSGGTVVLRNRHYLGDDYGITEGRLGFTLKEDSGKVSVKLRVVSEKYESLTNCIMFTFEGGQVICSDISNGMTYTLSTEGYTNEKGELQLEFADKKTEITVTSCGKQLVKVGYDTGNDYSVSVYSAKTSIYDKNNALQAEGENSQIQRAGYFQIEINKLAGYIDDLYFTRTEIDQSLPETDTERVIDYGNWVATDDLDRNLPLNNATGNVKTDKKVGVFYFLCWVGAGIHVQDNTRIYLESGTDGLRKYLEERGGEGYWAEPYFGYYRNTDTWVYRKHAYMLDAAGVDFIFLDVSNARVFEEGHLALFDTWLQIRKEGGHTPQICFLTGDTSSTFEKDMKDLRRTVYSDKNRDKYKELFFMWEGKPLVFGNISEVSPEMKTYIEENFTVRGCWAWCDKDGYWSWMDETWKQDNGTWEQHRGRDINGNFEQVSVTMGHHASTDKGRSYIEGHEPNNYEQNFMFSYEDTPKGLGFAYQFESAIRMDPQVIMITGWNEWIAGNTRGNNSIAFTPAKNVCYVDEFNPEFSRDGEPMKIRDGVGFGDNYYYQMVSFIRKFKGTTALQTAEGQGKDLYTADESAWESVGPEFRDTIGDAEFRNTICYDAAFRYINGTGRNDIDYAKVSQDSKYVYFMVKCVSDIVKADDSTWMNLYINTDFNRKTGWEGYDYVINRSRTGETVSVEKFDGTSWTSASAGTADYQISGRNMVVRVEKSLLGLKGSVNFDFKWADNSTETGNVMEFMDLGDAAPNDRYSFRFVSDPGSYERAVGIRGGLSIFGLGTGPSIIIIIAGAIVIAAAIAVIIIKTRKKKV